MKLVIITNEELKKELIASANPEGVFYTESLDEAIQFRDADAIIDLLFTKDDKRISMLASYLPKIIIVNSVEHTCSEIHSSFIRINGWPTLLRSTIVEATGSSDHIKVQQIFGYFGKTVEWTSDLPGFISARIITCIIREAKYVFSEGISSKEDIDKAMKLGTSYTFGPFEWYEKIGPAKVDALLNKLPE